MKTNNIKLNFHKLIDNSSNLELLEILYEALLYSEENNWKFSEKEKEIVLQAYEESKDEENLICADKIKAKHLKWISK